MIVISIQHGLKKFSMFNGEAIKQALILTATKYISEQRIDINNGKSPTGEDFVAYSPIYDDMKRRAGRNTEASWLNATGKMLRSQRVHAKASPRRVEVYCSFDGSRPTNVFRQKGKRKKRTPDSPLTIGMSNTRQVANADLARWNNKRRPFIGVSPDGARLLLEYFVGQLKRESR